jgi:hypothetical protein
LGFKFVTLFAAGFLGEINIEGVGRKKQLPGL